MRQRQLGGERERWMKSDGGCVCGGGREREIGERESVIERERVVDAKCSSALMTHTHTDSGQLK
jgi:hypothetical protein